MLDMMRHNIRARSICCIEIKNNVVKAWRNKNPQEMNKPKATCFKDAKYDNRMHEIVSFIQHITQEYKINYCCFFVYSSDNYMFEHQELPFFVFARPINKKGILFPDHALFCKDDNHNWTEHLRKCKVNVSNSIAPEPTIFFRGADTGANKHNLRETLSHLPSPMQVIISKEKQPMITFSQYKYLLNLPGNQPWSYRFKYLLATGSLVLDVALQQLYTKSQMHNDANHRWCCFFDVLFENNKHYVQYDLPWDMDGNDKHNTDETKKLISFLYQKIEYFESHPREYYKITNAAIETTQLIDQENIVKMAAILLNKYSCATKSLHLELQKEMDFMANDDLFCAVHANKEIKSARKKQKIV